MLISDVYREQNRELHEREAAYGTSGHRYAPIIRAIAKQLDSTDILDYGCGKRTLEKALGFDIQNYDPAIPACSTMPRPADIVVCSDVMEHVEPDSVSGVIAHLRDLAKQVCFVQIATVPAKKILVDGRNAHLIVKPMPWWLAKFYGPFQVNTIQDTGGGFYMILR